MSFVTRSVVGIAKSARFVSARSFSRAAPRNAELDVIQRLYLDELKKASVEAAKKPNYEQEILKTIQSKRENRAKKIEAEEAARVKLVETLKQELASFESKAKSAAKPAAEAAAPEASRDDGKRIFLLKQFGFREDADLTVVGPELLKRLGEKAVAQALKEYQGKLDARLSRGQWVPEPLQPQIQALAAKLNKAGIPAGADLYVAAELSREDWENSELAVIADDLLKLDVREEERKRIIDRIMVLIVLEHSEEEQELLKLVGGKDSKSVDSAKAAKAAERERIVAEAEAKTKLYLAKLGFPAGDDLATLTVQVAKKADH